MSLNRVTFPIGYTNFAWKLAGLIETEYYHLTEQECTGIVTQALCNGNWASQELYLKCFNSSAIAITSLDDFIRGITVTSRLFPASLTAGEYNDAILICIAAMLLNRRVLGRWISETPGSTNLKIGLINAIYTAKCAKQQRAISTTSYRNWNLKSVIVSILEDCTPECRRKIGSIEEKLISIEPI